MKIIRSLGIVSLIFVLFLSCRAVSAPDAGFIKKVRAIPAKQFEKYQFGSRSTLKKRVKPIPDFVLSYWKEYDETDKYTGYLPDKKEMKLIKKVLKTLPPLHKTVLKEKLLAIYFVNDFLGSGMTDYVLDKNNNVYVILLFNSAVLKDSFTERVARKENTCFIKDDPLDEIKIDCGDKYSGFLYIFLHESTHAVDYIKYITPYVEPDIKKINKEAGVETPFTRGVWNAYRQPRPNCDFSVRKDVTFYGFGKGPKIKISNAAAAYKQLAGSPFTSLYGSKSWAEDLAEFFTFYHLTKKLKQPYTIQVLRQGKVIYSLEPMENPLVAERFPLMERLYGSD